MDVRFGGSISVRDGRGNTTSEARQLMDLMDRGGWRDRFRREIKSDTATRIVVPAEAGKLTAQTLSDDTANPIPVLLSTPGETLPAFLGRILEHLKEQGLGTGVAPKATTPTVTPTFDEAMAVSTSKVVGWLSRALGGARA